MEYTIAYLPDNLPNFFDTKIKIKKAILKLENQRLIINSKNKNYEITFSKIINCELAKYYKVATYIHLKTREETLNFFVPRINLFDWFIVNNYFKTKKVFGLIKDKTK